MKSTAKLALGIVAIAALGFSSLASAADAGNRSANYNAQERPAFAQHMQGMHNPGERPEMSEAVKTALENNDYDAFIQAMKDQVEERFTQERFDEMVIRHQEGQAVRTAMENGDYQGFIAALGDKAPDDLTEEKFNQMQEVHTLMEAGEYEQAKELAKEYGLKRPGMGKMKGFKKGKFRSNDGELEN